MLINWGTQSAGPPIYTAFTPHEADRLRQLAENANCLEVGCAFGFSTITMAMVAQHVTTIDDHKLMNSLEGFLLNLKTYRVEDRVIHRIGDSKALLPTYPDDTFDLAFVDGDHEEDSVRFDAEQCYRLVKPGGTLAFHDYGEDRHPGVKKVLNEMFGRPKRLVDTLYVLEKPK